MTAKEIFELRENGRAEEAYEAARQLYATDKSPYVSTAMFWTAADIFKVRISEQRIEEAEKILMALERLLPNVPDRGGWVESGFNRCVEQLKRHQTHKAGYDNISEHIQMGEWGEDIAAAYLRDNGYVILERDWHSGHRDIDIIANKDGHVVFVEVKTRQNTDFGEPEQAVDWKKRHNLRLAISHYVKYQKIDAPIRFDIITVVGKLGSANPTINHIEDVYIME